MKGFLRLKKFSDISVSQLWSLTIAARKMPKGFGNLNPLSITKLRESEMFIMEKDLKNFSSQQSNNVAIKNLFSEWYISYQSALMSLRDLESISFSSLSNETLYKVYSVIITQSSEVARLFLLSHVIEIIDKDTYLKLTNLFSEKSITEDQILSVSLNLFKEEMFVEIGKRIYKKKDDLFYMSPEDFHAALYGGVFDEEELNERKTNYIMVYDLEKDAPHIYSGEKARALEAILSKS